MGGVYKVTYPVPGKKKKARKWRAKIKKEGHPPRKKLKDTQKMIPLPLKEKGKTGEKSPVPNNKRAEKK